MLGNKQTPERIRRFERDTTFDPPKIRVDLAQWYWALGQAQEALGLSRIDQFAVRFEDAFIAPRLQLYVRRWSDTRHNKQEQEMFESIGKGTVLTFNPILLSTQEPSQSAGKLRAPTLSEMKDIMGCVGHMLGLSPWGSKFGYGRFTVETLEAVTEPLSVIRHLEENISTVGRELPDADAEFSGVGSEADDQGEGSGVFEENTVAEEAGLE